MFPLIQEKAKAAFETQRFDEALLLLRQGQKLVGALPQLQLLEAQCLYYLRCAPEAIALLEGLIRSAPDVAE